MTLDDRVAQLELAVTRLANLTFAHGLPPKSMGGIFRDLKSNRDDAAKEGRVAIHPVTKSGEISKMPPMSHEPPDRVLARIESLHKMNPGKRYVGKTADGKIVDPRGHLGNPTNEHGDEIKRDDHGRFA